MIPLNLLQCISTVSDLLESALVIQGEKASRKSEHIATCLSSLNVKRVVLASLSDFNEILELCNHF